MLCYEPHVSINPKYVPDTRDATSGRRHELWREPDLLVVVLRPFLVGTAEQHRQGLGVDGFHGGTGLDGFVLLRMVNFQHRLVVHFPRTRSLHFEASIKIGSSMKSEGSQITF